MTEELMEGETAEAGAKAALKRFSWLRFFVKCAAMFRLGTALAGVIGVLGGYAVDSAVAVGFGYGVAFTGVLFWLCAGLGSLWGQWTATELAALRRRGSADATREATLKSARAVARIKEVSDQRNAALNRIIDKYWNVIYAQNQSTPAFNACTFRDEIAHLVNIGAEPDTPS